MSFFLHAPSPLVSVSFWFLIMSLQIEFSSLYVFSLFTFPHYLILRRCRHNRKLHLHLAFAKYLCCLYLFELPGVSDKPYLAPAAYSQQCLPQHVINSPTWTRTIPCLLSCVILWFC